MAAAVRRIFASYLTFPAKYVCQKHELLSDRAYKDDGTFCLARYCLKFFERTGGFILKKRGKSGIINGIQTKYRQAKRPA
ncbi:MAG TPA: hypothetical protein DF364_00315 [Ruminococcaceae bacterium]|nr:hypothetical protein [Oscillospiraceae bacterium]